MMTESNRVGSLLTPPESYRRALCVATLALALASPGAAGAQSDALAASAGGACARLEDGSLRCWGEHPSSAAGVPMQLDLEGDELALGDRFACVRNPAGEVRCVGEAIDAMLGAAAGSEGAGATEATGPTRTLTLPDRYQTIVARGDVLCGIDARGRVHCMGPTPPPFARVRRGATPAPFAAHRISIGPPAIAIATDGRSVCAVYGRRRDVSCVGRRAGRPTARDRMLGFRDVAQLAMDRGGLYALDTAGRLTSNHLRYQPAGARPPRGGRPNRGVAVLGLPTLASVDAAYGRLCVRTPEGEVRCAGDNEYGQLGAGNTEPQSGFVVAPGLRGSDRSGRSRRNQRRARSCQRSASPGRVRDLHSMLRRQVLSHCSVRRARWHVVSHRARDRCERTATAQ